VITFSGDLLPSRPNLMRENPVAPIKHHNGFLSTLPQTVIELVHPHLKPCNFAARDILFSTGDRLERVYFPDSGVISLVVELDDGEMIEAAMVGRDSMLGAATAFDGQLSLNKAIVQIAGSGSILSVSRLREVAEHNCELRTALSRHEQALFAQAQQAAACNVSHTVESRLARWLLRARDLVGSDKLPLTQDSLARMLGARRTTVSLIANTLQNAGLIRYSRGHINIVLADRLKDVACECYQVVKRAYDRLLENSNY
jgi:CRP-like cAMP-binding protein